MVAQSAFRTETSRGNEQPDLEHIRPEAAQAAVGQTRPKTALAVEE
jgi:hypothetical protein